MLVSLYIYKGIVGWSTKWSRHGWHTSSGEVGHQDLREQILWERERGGWRCFFAGSIRIWVWLAM